MQNSIARHDSGKKGYRRYLGNSEEDREEQVSRVENKSSYVDFALRNIKIEASMRLALDPDAMEVFTWDAWATYMQLAEALFAVSTAPSESEIERLINRKVRTLEDSQSGPSAGASNWLTAFFLAITCRDNERSRSLCEIPIDFIRDSGQSQGTECDDYVYPWISAIQDLILGRAGLAGNLLSAMDLSEPEKSRIGTAEYMNNIVFPQINSLYRLAQ